MENPHMNICSALLFINKMQIKTIKHCGTPVSMAKMVTKLLAVGSLDERSDHLIISFAAAGGLRVQSLREKKYTNIHSVHDPEMQPRVIPTEK